MTSWPEAFTLTLPKAPLVPFVFTSPHSGHYYPPDFLVQTALSFHELRALEDFAVDRLFAWAPALGASLLTARYARAYIDLNRHPYAVDPDIFSAPLPPAIQQNLMRQRHGLGTLPTMALNGQRVYRDRLSPDTLNSRLQRVHIPYHDTIRRLLHQTRRHFGAGYLFDCHSMPSCAGRHPRQRSIDIVLGDQFGSTFCPHSLLVLQRALEAAGYHVALNTPYAGAYTTQTYAAPAERLYTLQVEINRNLYMDEATLAWLPEPASRLAQNLRQAFAVLARQMQQDTASLAAE